MSYDGDLTKLKRSEILSIHVKGRKVAKISFMIVKVECKVFNTEHHHLGLKML